MAQITKFKIVINKQSNYLWQCVDHDFYLTWWLLEEPLVLTCRVQCRAMYDPTGFSLQSAMQVPCILVLSPGGCNVILGKYDPTGLFPRVQCRLIHNAQ